MSTYKQSGIKFGKNCHGSVKRLEVVANSWVAECERFENSLDDAPWWYNERANISIVASAASRIDWIALEEYGTDKIEKSGSKSNSKSNKKGRCDLFLYDCAGNNSRNKNPSDYSYAIEAKQAWAAMTGKSGNYARIEKKWAQAIEASRELHRDEANHRLAMLFVVPYTKIPINIEQRMALISRCEKLDKYDAIAWYWTKKEERDIHTNSKSGNYFPGVILAIRRIKKGNGPTRHE